MRHPTTIHAMLAYESARTRRNARFNRMVLRHLGALLLLCAAMVAVAALA